jgi:hypothetical protein
VGERKFDNYHRASNLRGMPATATQIALDDSPAAIRRKAWAETDQAYRIASQRLIQLKTNQQVKAAPSDDSDDFSTEPPSSFSKLPPKYSFSAPDWSARLRRLSAEFNKHPRILNSSITVIVQREVKTLVNTEGSKLEHGRLFARVMITARGKTGDGMDMSSSESFETDDTAKMPKDAQILAAIEKVAKDLDGLLSAPPVDPFVGPAILSGRAAGVFFHEIFGHRIEGHRQKDENDGQTFTKKVNEAILPTFLSVIFDPTVKEAAGQDLNGTYAFDDEGVKARRLPIVENGLPQFERSRSRSAGRWNRLPPIEPVRRIKECRFRRRAAKDAESGNQETGETIRLIFRAGDGRVHDNGPSRPASVHGNPVGGVSRVSGRQAG